MEHFDAALELIAEKKGMRLEDVWSQVRPYNPTAVLLNFAKNKKIFEAMYFFSNVVDGLTGVVVAQCSLAPKLRRYVSMMTRAPTPGHMLKEVQTLAGKEGVLDCPGLSEAAN